MSSLYQEMVPYGKEKGRIHHWKEPDPRVYIYSRPLSQIQFLLFLSLICAIISGAWTSLTWTMTDASYALREAASILLLVTVVLVFPVCFFALSVSKYGEERRDALLLQVVIVLPLFLIRSVYSVIQSYLSNRQSPLPNIWVYFSLLILMDYLAIVALTLVGLSVQRTIPPGKVGVTSVENPPEPSPLPQFNEMNQQPAPPQYYPHWRKRRDRRYPGAIHLLFDFLFDADHNHY